MQKKKKIPKWCRTCGIYDSGLKLPFIFFGSQSCSQIGWLNVNKWCIVFETKLCLLKRREFTFSESQLITQSRESTDFTHKKVFDKGMQSHFSLYKKSCSRAEKLFQHICVVGAKKLTAKEHNWVQTGGFDRSAARNSMKYFPQIWNVVFFT